MLLDREKAKGRTTQSDSSDPQRNQDLKKGKGLMTAGFLDKSSRQSGNTKHSKAAEKDAGLLVGSGIKPQHKTAEELLTASRGPLNGDFPPETLLSLAEAHHAGILRPSTKNRQGNAALKSSDTDAQRSRESNAKSDPATSSPSRPSETRPVTQGGASLNIPSRLKIKVKPSEFEEDIEVEVPYFSSSPSSDSSTSCYSATMENVRKQRSRQARAFEPNPSTPPASSPPDSPPRERQPRIINLEHSNLLISSLDGSESPTTAINRLYREAGVELDPSDAREHEEELAWQDADSMHGQESEIQERASGAANASSSSSAGASTAFHSEDQGVQQVFPEQEQGKGSSEPDEDLILIFDQPDGSRVLRTTDSQLVVPPHLALDCDGDQEETLQWIAQLERMGYRKTTIPPAAPGQKLENLVKRLRPEIREPEPPDPVFLEKQAKVRALMKEGNALQGKGSVKEGLDALKKALKFDERNAVLHINIAAAYYRMEKFPQAIKAADNAERLDNKIRDLYWWRGLAHRAQDEFQEALQDYQKALQLPSTAKDYQKLMHLLKEHRDLRLMIGVDLIKQRREREQQIEKLQQQQQQQHGRRGSRLGQYRQIAELADLSSLEDWGSPSSRQESLQADGLKLKNRKSVFRL